MNPGRRLCWTNPRILLTVGVIFLAGFLAGAFTMHFAGYRIVAQTPPPPYWEASGKQLSLELLSSELELTPVQRQALETVLDDFVLYLQILQAQMEDVKANGKAGIMRVLDERQKKKFEKILAQMQQVRH
jgi:hypothetical protein